LPLDALVVGPRLGDAALAELSAGFEIVERSRPARSARIQVPETDRNLGVLEL
jgi:hypothetical protein